MDIKLRRRAIYTGLRPYLNEVTLLDAMHLWQSKYSDKPKFAFAEFLSECCQNKALRAQRTNMLSSIFKALDMPERELLPDPFDEVLSQPTDLTPEELIADNKTIVFSNLFDHLLALLTDKQAMEVRVSLLKALASLPLDVRRKVDLREWLDKKSSNLAMSYALSDIRQLMNLAYVAICELVGPVKADQLLNQAMHASTEMARKMEVSLHEFL